MIALPGTAGADALDDGLKTGERSCLLRLRRAVRV